MRKTFDLNISENNSDSSPEIKYMIVSSKHYIKNSFLAYAEEYDTYDELIINNSEK